MLGQSNDKKVEEAKEPKKNNAQKESHQVQEHVAEKGDETNPTPVEQVSVGDSAASTTKACNKSNNTNKAQSDKVCPLT